MPWYPIRNKVPTLQERSADELTSWYAETGRKRFAAALQVLDNTDLRSTLLPCVCMLCDRAACLTKVPLCDDCKVRFRDMLAQPCPRCGLPRSECICRENRWLRAPLWYDQPDAHWLVSVLKKHANRSHTRFLASLLAAVSIGRYDAVTFVPRRPAAIRFHGYDHARLLATYTADCMGLPLVRTLRCHAVTDQKNLSSEQRTTSANGRYYAICPTVHAYPRLLLVDDICTTGETLRTCARLLRKAGAAAVTCAVLTHTSEPL